MIVVDEYLAVRVMRGRWPTQLPDDELALTTSRHWRLLQALHGARGGQLSQALGELSPAARDSVRHPHPEVLQVVDPVQSSTTPLSSRPDSAAPRRAPPQGALWPAPTGGISAS